MSRFTLTDLPLAGLKCVERHTLGDARGSLTRLFCPDELAAAGWKQAIAQINHTVTIRRGTIRGLHYQIAPHEEMKLVSCIKGAVWDIALDLRPDSATFMHWHAERLSRDNNRALLIPEGFAHGFQTLTDDAELIYLHSAPHVPHAEAGIHALDARLGIPWPLEVSLISTRDSNFPFLDTEIKRDR